MIVQKIFQLKVPAATDLKMSYVQSCDSENILPFFVLIVVVESSNPHFHVDEIYWCLVNDMYWPSVLWDRLQHPCDPTEDRRFGEQTDGWKNNVCSFLWWKTGLTSFMMLECLSAFLSCVNSMWSLAWTVCSFFKALRRAVAHWSQNSSLILVLLLHNIYILNIVAEKIKLHVVKTLGG